MIEIYNTLIDEGAVIGVGPLMVKRPTDPTTVTMYRERAYYFDVYTPYAHFVITTEWLSYNKEYALSSAEEHAAIVAAHKALRRCLIDGNFSILAIYKEHGTENRLT